MVGTDLIQMDGGYEIPGDLKGGVEKPSLNSVVAGREPVIIDVLELGVGALQGQVAQVKYLFVGEVVGLEKCDIYICIIVAQHKGMQVNNLDVCRGMAGAVDRPAEGSEKGGGQVNIGRPLVPQPGMEEEGILEYQGERRFSKADCTGNVAFVVTGDGSRSRQESPSVERGRLVTRYNKVWEEMQFNTQI